MAPSNQLCACGCGQYTELIEKTSAAQGRAKGEPNAYVYTHGGKGPRPHTRKVRTPDEEAAWRQHEAEMRRAQGRRRYEAKRAEVLAGQREWRQVNAERLKAAQRRRYATDSEYRLRMRANAAAHQPPAEVKREQYRVWYAANLDLARAQRRLRENRRRARKRAAFVEDVDALAVLERDDGVCGICGEDVDPLNFHVDHVLSLAVGGWHAYDNVQASHPACNTAKGV